MTDLMTMPQIQEKRVSKWRQFWQSVAPYYFRFDNILDEESDEFFTALSKIFPAMFGALVIALTSYQFLFTLDGGDPRTYALWGVGLIGAIYVTLESVTNGNSMYMSVGGFLLMPAIPLGMALAAANAPIAVILAVAVAFTIVGVMLAGIADLLKWVDKAWTFFIKSDRVQMVFMRLAFGKEHMRHIRTQFELLVEGDPDIPLYLIKGVLPNGEQFQWAALTKATCYDEVAKRLNISVARRVLPEILTLYSIMFGVAFLFIISMFIYLQLVSWLIPVLFGVL